MVYIKSILAGFATAFISTMLFVVVLVVLILRDVRAKVPPGAEVGVDVVSLAKAPRFWIVAILGFGIGFWWQYRGSSR